MISSVLIVTVKSSHALKVVKNASNVGTEKINVYLTIYGFANNQTVENHGQGKRKSIVFMKFFTQQL